MLINPQATVAPHVTSRLAESVGLRYLCALLIIPAVAYILPFFAERAPQLRSFTGSYYGHILEYGFNMANQNADIVIFGDSSALYGFDPIRLSSDTHLRAVNIPNTLGSFPVTQDDALRLYLKSNRPPRLIVFVFAPWSLNAGNQPNEYMYEGEEMMLRHDSWRKIRQFVRWHASELLQFPFRFYAVDEGISRLTLSQPPAPRRLVLGHMEYDWGASAKGTQHLALANGCSFPTSLLDQGSDVFARSMTSQFKTNSTRTLVYISAIPNCAHADVFARSSYSALEALPPIILPPSFFADDSKYVHVLPPAVGEVTDALATTILRELSAP